MLNHQFDIEINKNLGDNIFSEIVVVPYEQCMSTWYDMYNTLFYLSLLIVGDFCQNDVRARGFSILGINCRSRTLAYLGRGLSSPMLEQF